MSDAASFRFTLCDSAPSDDENIAAIYAHHVQVDLGTFEDGLPANGGPGVMLVQSSF
jgi:hypothetical protein